MHEASVFTAILKPVLTDLVFFQYLHDLLETCQFKAFWNKVHTMSELVKPISGFEDSIRKYVCHVVGITYQVKTIDICNK